MANDLHIQVSIEYNGQERLVCYGHLSEPQQGRHDHTVDQLADPPLTLHLYWCPKLPGEATREALLPGLEQFVQPTLAEQVLLTTADRPNPTPLPHYQEIYNCLTKQPYIYRAGGWLPETTKRELLPHVNQRQVVGR